MADIIINNKQQDYIRGIVDSYISLHKETNRMYCNYPEKQKNCAFSDNYDCTTCSRKFYEELKKDMIEKSGLNKDGQSNTL